MPEQLCPDNGSNGLAADRLCFSSLDRDLRPDRVLTGGAGKNVVAVPPAGRVDRHHHMVGVDAEAWYPRPSRRDVSGPTLNRNPIAPSTDPLAGINAMKSRVSMCSYFIKPWFLGTPATHRSPQYSGPPMDFKNRSSSAGTPRPVDLWLLPRFAVPDWRRSGMRSTIGIHQQPDEDTISPRPPKWHVPSPRIILD